jgi:hypothetical protein
MKQAGAAGEPTAHMKMTSLDRFSVNALKNNHEADIPV